MRKQSLLSRNSGTYTSPGTPDYQNGSEFLKGWCSERVPLPSTSKRHIGASVLSGRALPSKWDDAERWITSPSPISASNVHRNLFAQPQRKPKSKSGPLGPQGLGGFSNNSPFCTGVLVPNCVQLHYGSGSDGLVNNVLINNNADNGSAVDRIASLPGWSDTLSESSEPSSQDDKFGSVKYSETTVSGDVSRRDRATQMSPSESQSSSSKRSLSFSTSPPLVIPNLGSHNGNSDRVEVKDLQVDIMTRQSKKKGAKNSKNDSPDVKVVTSWEISETSSKSLSKLQREEAKINAWENLQKAKAETAIQKLEMKLEKRRAASMNKILNKLRSAQTKAQEMRNSISGSCDYPRAETSHKPTLFCMFPLSGKGKKR